MYKRQVGNGFFWCANPRTLELLVRFTVIRPNYFLLLAPTQLDAEMAAGSNETYTFQLYNAMPAPLDWHVPCADLPTAAGAIRLHVDTAAVPCGVGTPSGLGQLEFQGVYAMITGQLVGSSVCYDLDLDLDLDLYTCAHVQTCQTPQTRVQTRVQTFDRTLYSRTV